MGKLSDTEVRIFRQLIIRRQNDAQTEISVNRFSAGAGSHSDVSTREILIWLRK